MSLAAKKGLKALHRLPLSAIPSDDEGCAICRGVEPYDGSDHCAVQLYFRCNHIFGLSCLRIWIIDREQNSRPFCRQQVFDPTGALPYSYVEPSNAVSSRRYPERRFGRPSDAELGLAIPATRYIVGMRGVQGLPAGFIDDLESKAWNTVSYLIRSGEPMPNDPSRLPQPAWDVQHIQNQLEQALLTVFQRHISPGTNLLVKKVGTGVQALLDEEDIENLVRSYVHFIICRLCDE